ncbi:MAG TPA: folylpolyglutamate synthase/dihydrofolate synthase family protein [Myxococcaceae bacterium]|nr:folylpolyglutamate synthase/dihydrofolate synthase family protein [Myxococcaceae bacterium]
MTSRIAASLSRLERLGPSTIALGLGRMERALAALGHPEQRLRRVLHVAGTNGKGSTCAFASSMLSAMGMRVGLYTSPHLVHFNERLRIDGVPISDARLAERIEEVAARLPSAFDGPEALTYFEMATLLAFWHFEREGLDAVVLETGLGGRLDATRACIPSVTAITPIALDHREYLGDSLGSVAAEKAGIIRPGVPLIVGAQPPPALEVLRREAAALGAPWIEASPGGGAAVDPVLVDATLGLAGPHQRENAAVAVAAVRALTRDLGDLDEAQLRAGLRDTRWPGRFERVEGAPLLILDGAHNPAGAQSLAAALEAEVPDRPRQLVFGALADKDAVQMLRVLLPHVERVFLVAPDSPRALSPARLLQQLPPQLARSDPERLRVTAGLAEALSAAREAAGPEGVVVVAGSLVLVGSVGRQE